MKKYIVASIVALTVALVGAASVNAAFTRNLSVGASGPDVAELQGWLISRGYDIPAITAGTAQPGYFGSQTKAAVAAYQTKIGLPAFGFFGPLTIASLGSATVGVPPVVVVQCPIGYDCTPKPGTTPGTTPVVVGGSEGQIIEIDNASADIETSLDEGEDNVKVFGVEFEAEDSDMLIERVDVDFTLTDAATASDDLEDYITEVTLYNGSTKVATLNVDKASINDAGSSDFSTSANENDVYAFRFTGLKVVVKEGATAELYVAVSAVNNVDTDDIDDEWAVIIPDNGIRAVDGKGISDTYVSGDLTEENFSIGTVSAGELDLSADSGDNEDRVLVLNTNGVTNGLEVMNFTLESDSSTNNVTEINVDIATTTATTTSVADVIQRLHLYADGKLVGSESISIPTVGGATATFDNLDIDIKEDDEVVFLVRADFKDDAELREGYEFALTVDASEIEAEDSEGDDVTVTGDVTGGDIELLTSGITAKFIGQTANKSFTADAAGEQDIGTFTVTFSVTANEEDVYIDRTVTRYVSAASFTAGNGFIWATTTDSTVGTTSLSASISSYPDSDDTSGLFKIDKGATRTFLLSVDLDASDIDGYAALNLAGINWTTDSSDTTPNNFYTTNLEGFSTFNQSLYTF